ncbi:hypothetical protein FRC10_003025 [Ceratobasidium sp. 414]|nr:hypothetical protein FRC10_003025 [Ceratobasidium sp. 414]
MTRTFWGHPAPEDKLAATTLHYKYPFAQGGGAGLFMAFKIFDGLEIFGPLRVMAGRVNSEYGLIFVLGRDDAPLESIPIELKTPLEEMHGHPPRLWTWDEVQAGEVDNLWRGGDLK